MKRKRLCVLAVVLVVVSVLGACAANQPGMYQTQKGAAIGAALGALVGQALGRDTEGTLIGLSAGTVLGALVGNAFDQSAAAARASALSGKRVVYYDDHGAAVDYSPAGPFNQKTKCRKVRKRTWKNGDIIEDTVEEVCEGEKTTGEY